MKNGKIVNDNGMIAYPELLELFAEYSTNYLMAGGGLEIINILADLENLIEGKTLFLQQAKDENLLRDTLGADHVEVDND